MLRKGVKWIVIVSCCLETRCHNYRMISIALLLYSSFGLALVVYKQWTIVN